MTSSVTYTCSLFVSISCKLTVNVGLKLAGFLVNRLLFILNYQPYLNGLISDIINIYLLSLLILNICENRVT